MLGNLRTLSLVLSACWFGHACAAPAALDDDLYRNALLLQSDSFWSQARAEDLAPLLRQAKHGEILPGIVSTHSTAFHVALQNHASLAMLQQLRAALPQMVGLGDYPQSLLATAIKARHPAATIDWLIAQGADVEQADYHHPRPLLQAIEQGADAAVIDVLVRAGADVGYFDRSDSNMDAFDAAVQTDYSATRQAVARHLPVPEAGSETMEAILIELSRQTRDSADAPQVSYEILSVLLERGMSSAGTYCDPQKPYCLADDRSNLMDLAIKIQDPQLIEYLGNKGL